MKKEQDESLKIEDVSASTEKKKKRLVISIRDLTVDEAAHVSGGKPPVTNGGTTMCCW